MDTIMASTVSTQSYDRLNRNQPAVALLTVAVQSWAVTGVSSEAHCAAERTVSEESSTSLPVSLSAAEARHSSHYRRPTPAQAAHHDQHKCVQL